MYYYDKFKICCEFIIMINSDMFKNLLIYSKFKGGAHAGKKTSRWRWDPGCTNRDPACPGLGRKTSRVHINIW